jgi:hypothetical protein
MKTCKSQVRDPGEAVGIRALTLSKAVEHARGCVATKIGLLDMIFSSIKVNIRRKAFSQSNLYFKQSL